MMKPCKHGLLKNPIGRRRCRRAPRTAKLAKKRWTPAYQKPRELGLRPKWSLVALTAAVVGIAAFSAGRSSAA